MNTQKAARDIIAHHATKYTAKRDVDGVTIEHALWMLGGIAEGYVRGEKAHRWLGYAQALLVILDVTTLEIMKQRNRSAK